MAYEPPTLTLRHGGGREASRRARVDLGRMRTETPSLTAARRLLLTHPQLNSSVCLLVGGSLALGWGHPKSDLDVQAVVTAPLDPLPQESLRWHRTWISTRDPVVRTGRGEAGPFRVDLELWTEAQVDELLGRFAGSAVAVDGDGLLGLAERQLFHRLTVGLPLAGNGWLEARRRAVLASCYGSWLTANRRRHAEQALEDVSGLLDGGDLTAAVFSAREGLVAALEAVLARRGDFSVSQKWLGRRAAAAGLSEPTVEECRTLLLMDGCTRKPEDWIERAVSAAQRLVIAAEEDRA